MISNQLFQFRNRRQKSRLIAWQVAYSAITCVTSACRACCLAQQLFSSWNIRVMVLNLWGILVIIFQPSKHCLVIEAEQVTKRSPIDQSIEFRTQLKRKHSESIPL